MGMVFLNDHQVDEVVGNQQINLDLSELEFALDKSEIECIYQAPLAQLNKIKVSLNTFPVTLNTFPLNLKEYVVIKKLF